MRYEVAKFWLLAKAQLILLFDSITSINS